MKTKVIIGLAVVGLTTIFVAPAKAGVSVDIRLGFPFPFPRPPVVVAPRVPLPCPPPVIVAPPPPVYCPPPVVVVPPPYYRYPGQVGGAYLPVPYGRPAFVPPGHARGFGHGYGYGRLDHRAREERHEHHGGSHDRR